MCPTYALRGRQAHDGRPRDRASAAAKVPEPRGVRAGLVIHATDRAPQGRSERYPSMNSTDGTGCGSPRRFGFDAAGAVLAAQTMAPHQEPTKRAAAEAANHWCVRCADSDVKYTRQTAVETMPYEKALHRVPEPHRAREPQHGARSPVQHLEVSVEEAGRGA